MSGATEPVPVRQEWIDVAAQAIARCERFESFPGTPGARRAMAHEALGAVAPLIAAEAAARERERIVEALKERSQDRLSDDGRYIFLNAAKFIEGLPAPGPEETT